MTENVFTESGCSDFELLLFHSGNKDFITLNRAYVKVTPVKTCEQLVDHDRLSQFSCMKESRNAKFGACLVSN